METCGRQRAGDATATTMTTSKVWKERDGENETKSFFFYYGRALREHLAFISMSA